MKVKVEVDQIVGKEVWYKGEVKNISDGLAKQLMSTNYVSQVKQATKKAASRKAKK